MDSYDFNYRPCDLGMKLILVIPDGLSLNNSNFKLSKTYQSALDLSIKESKLTSAKICLLPANKFGSPNFEQFWARDYLINKNIKPESILVGESKGGKYFSTRDNFLMAIKYGFRNCLENEKIFLNEQIINGEYTLISSHLHIDRALLVLNAISFKKPNQILVSYSNEEKFIIRRLFYYQYPILRMIYECFLMMGLFFETKLKIFFKKFLDIN